MQTQSPFLKDHEVAERYRISRPTVWRWASADKLPKPVKLAEGATRWRLADLQSWEAIHFSPISSLIDVSEEK